MHGDSKIVLVIDVHMAKCCVTTGSIHVNLMLSVFVTLVYDLLPFCWCTHSNNNPWKLWNQISFLVQINIFYNSFPLILKYSRTEQPEMTSNIQLELNCFNCFWPWAEGRKSGNYPPLLEVISAGPAGLGYSQLWHTSQILQRGARAHRERERQSASQTNN